MHLVEDCAINITGEINGTTITVKWTRPAGDCCVQSLVMTSESSMPFVTNDTSFILTNLLTQQRREDAFVSVRCLDMIGTQGPKVVYKPVVGMLKCVFKCVRLRSVHYRSSIC